MTGRRELTTAVALCLFGASAVLIAAQLEWVSYFAASSRTGVEINVAGAAAPLARALGLAALAGVVGIVAARGRGRVAVGVVLVLVGVGAAVVAARAAAQPAGQGALDVVLPPGDPHSTAWPWVAAGGGVLVMTAGLLVAFRGAGWSSLAQRYDGPQRSPDAQPSTDAGLWDALSRGDDPT